MKIKDLEAKSLNDLDTGAGYLAGTIFKTHLPDASLAPMRDDDDDDDGPGGTGSGDDCNPGGTGIW